MNIYDSVNKYLRELLFKHIDGYEYYIREKKCECTCKNGNKCTNGSKYKQGNSYLCGMHINKQENKVDLNDAPKKKATRKNCDYNGFELICALCLVYESINNLNDILTMNYNCDKLKISYKGFKLYLDDIKTRDREKVNKYILQFKEHNKIPLNRIRHVYLTGKSVNHEILKQLNEGYDKKEVKADVYIEMNDDSWFGLSVKQNTECTKTNYSIYKFMPKEVACLLNEIKLNWLKKCGFPEHNENQKEAVNLALRPTEDNEYWNAVKKMIEKYKTHIRETLFTYIHSTNVKYEMFEFDGDKMYKLKEQRDDFKLYFELHNFKKANGEDRDASKIFYMYKEINTINANIQEYRVEVRFKNSNKHNGNAPQFLMHKI